MATQDKNVQSGQDFEFEVNIEPDASALRMFRSMSFTPWYALGEFDWWLFGGGTADWC